MTTDAGGRILEFVIRWLFSVGTAVLLLTSSVAQAQTPAYRSVVILADTQNIVRQQDDEFAVMIDWIVRNKHRENIDAVLHLGDLISIGGNLSTAFAQGDCGPGYPALQNSQCNACTDRIECLDTCEPDNADCRALCPTDPESRIVTKNGCFFVGDTCAACQRSVDSTQEQWAFFNRVWRNGDPERDLKGLDNASDPIPYMFVMGNHENLGSPTGDEIVDSAAGNVAVSGYADYYGESHWKSPGLEARFDQPGSDDPTRDRGFQYLGSFIEQVEIGIPALWDRVLSQAWRFRLGESPGPEMWINVVGHGPSRNTAGPTPAIDWAQAVIRCDPSANLDVPCNPSDPAILLSHRQLIYPNTAAGTDLWKQIIQEQPGIYKGRVLMALQGHLAPQNHVKAIGLGPPRALGMRTLNFIFNQQDVEKENSDALPIPIPRDERRWWMAAVRFRLSNAGIDDVQVVRINPVATNPAARIANTKIFPGIFYRPDWDQDSVNNWDDLCPYLSSVSGGTDSDGDGWGNACDSCPDNPDITQSDFDGDRIGDVCDLRGELDPDPAENKR